MSKIPPIECEFYDSRTDEFITEEEFIKRWNGKVRMVKSEKHTEKGDRESH